MRHERPLVTHHSSLVRYVRLWRQFVITAVVREAEYRVSFLLTRLATRDLDVEFPAPVISLDPRAVLDVKDVGRLGVTFEPVDEFGRRDDGSRVGRLRLSPDLVRGPAVLEVSYHLPAGRAPAGPGRIPAAGRAGQRGVRWFSTT